ncbi:MAG: ATP-binding cassette domain-containing protein [Chloroflexi bacterium]|nr:ATP-binding cassette domain-containing protein [Chloroflexota bacterium]
MLIEVKNLRKEFAVGGILFQAQRETVKAVDGVSFSIKAGTSLGLVGESGSGKTTVAKTMLRLHEPTAGEFHFDGQDVFALPRVEMRKLRRRIQIVHQNPNASLHPRMTVMAQIKRPLQIQGIGDRTTYENQVLDMLNRVGLNPEHARRFPHEFSGGQKQRIAVARALITAPEFVALDEPTSALDVSVQAQVLQLLRRLRSELELTYLFVSHDLGVIRYMCDEVAVMYLGQLVEHAEKPKLFANPLHPYTQSLLSVVPIPDPTMRHRDRKMLTGEIPSPKNPPSGCRFHTRCPHVMAHCKTDEPKMKEVESGHRVACHLYE